MIIGERIRTTINRSDFSVKEIADKLDTTPQNLYKLFKKESIDSRYLNSIAKVLDVSPAFFFDEGNFTKGLLKLKVPNFISQDQVDLLNNKIENLKEEIKVLKEKNTSLLEKIYDAQEKYIELIDEKTKLHEKSIGLQFYTAQELFNGDHLTKLHQAANMETWEVQKKELIEKYKELLENIK